MEREIAYIEKQIRRTQIALENLPKNAPERQKIDLCAKIDTLENILRVLEKQEALKDG